MFPTCSKSDFAGRNALSTVDLTISHPGSWKAGGPFARKRIRCKAPPQGRTDRPAGWYVARALGEEGTSPRSKRVGRSRVLIAGIACLLAAGGSACGGGERQDANEQAGEFPVEVVAAKFPPRQRLAETSDLVLEIENAGEETIPDLAITIFTGDEKADGSFNVRSEQQGLADPNRPVWVLEHQYPKVLKPGIERAELDDEPSAGAETAATDTYAFGPVAPGESITAVWRVTPVQGGTYTVSYEVAGGIDGKAKAVTADGSQVEGEFVVTILTKPPNTRVTDSGEVKTTP